MAGIKGWLVEGCVLLSHEPPSVAPGPKRSRVVMFDEVVNDALTEQTRAALGVVMNDIAKGRVPASSSI